MKTITVSLVTWNSLKYLPFCLQCLRHQQDVNYRLIVVDNNSTDGTLDYLQQQRDLTLIRNPENIGFSAAHNRAISETSDEFILVLNPDVFLKPDFLYHMLDTIDKNDSVGQVSGKLYRISEIAGFGISQTLDSVGMFFTTNHRHFDRGAGEIDVGQYGRLEYIFGVSGAAAFYRRTALESVAIHNEYFDTQFFAYREDADLSWRMQLMGWKALYTPYAQAYHVRSVRENHRRKDVTANINMHSVKNRFLMRIKNQTWRNGLRFLWPTLWRDILVIGYVMLCERSSLPAFWALFRLYPDMLHKRRMIMNNRKVNDAYISEWFTRKALQYNQGDN